MNIDIAATDQSILELVPQVTNLAMGYADSPDDTTTPYYVLQPLPGGLSSGGLGGNLEMGTQLYQVEIVGTTPEQVRLAQTRMHMFWAVYWSDLAGVLGPPMVSIGGIVRTDERTFVSTETVYLEVTGT